MPSNPTIHNGLFWFLSVTTLMSGLLGFLLKIDAFYNPDAYLVYNSQGLLLPGDGTTPFEVCAHFVIGIAYVGPLFGMGYAKREGSAAAKQAAAIFPFLYHAAMIPGVILVFSEALNPNKAPLVAAVSMHVVYAGLFYIFFQTAENDGKEKCHEWLNTLCHQHFNEGSKGIPFLSHNAKVITRYEMFRSEIHVK